MCKHISAMAYVWKSEDNCESWLSYHVGFGDGTQIIRISGIHLYPLNQLASLIAFSS